MGLYTCDMPKWGMALGRRRSHDVATVDDLQGMLAADAFASATARHGFPAISFIWYSSEPDEPKYLHDLRIDVY
jgi:hypothetical protein